MRVLHWEQFCGSSLDGQIELLELISASPTSAIFSAFETIENGRTEIYVQVFEGSDRGDAEQLLNRFQEAKYFQHPNLLSIGRTGKDLATGLVYICSPRADSTLGEFIDARRFTPREAREFVSQIISALSYLHAENFVFCNLRPTSVWKIGTAWLLADFSQMRLESQSNNKELRQVLTRQADVPPEAYEGIVSPAWDSWGLGVLIRTGMMPEPASPETPAPAQRGRQLRDVELPAPFDSITRDCLEPNPDHRITLDEIRARLAGAGTPPAPVNERVPVFERALTAFDARSSSNPQSSARVWMLVGFVVLILVFILWVGGAFGRLRSPSQAEASRRGAISEADRDSNAADPSPSINVTAGQADVLRLLDQWATAYRKRDAKALASFYTPVVTIYYDQKLLSRTQLQLEKEKQFKGIAQIPLYELARPQYRRIDGNTAVVTFDRSWRFTGRDWSQGSNQEQLTWELMNGNWKIASERELKTYWSRNSKGEVH